MAGFSVVVCVLFIQLRVVLGLVYLKSGGYTFYVIDPSDRISKFPHPNLDIMSGLPGEYRVLAGFPPGSTQPMWDHVFDLDLSNKVYYFMEDYCLWTEDGDWIGCATHCYDRSTDERFPNPYPSDKENPEKLDPTHGTTPDSPTGRQIFEYAYHCPIQKQPISNFRSSVLQLSPINGNNPDAPIISTPQDMIQTGPPYIPTLEPVKTPLTVSLNPEYSGDIDNTLGSPLEPLNLEKMFSRGLRKSPRDFKRERSKQ